MKQNKPQKTSEKQVEFKRVRTDSNFKMPKPFKRLSLTKEQMKVFIDAVETARLSDLRRGKSKEKDVA